MTRDIRKFNKKIIDNIDILFSFLLPIFILIFIFIGLNIYPFGSNNIINSDLYFQYLPIASKLQNAIKNGDGILYSFNGGLGNDFYSLNIYQNASPITWLFLVLFDNDHLVLGLTLMIMFKIGLISALMYCYLKNISLNNNIYNKILRISLASLYSLSGYVIAYYIHFMWLECLMCLPLIILAIRKNNHKIYVFSLTFMLLTSYYVGLMTLIFVVLYYFKNLYIERKENYRNDIIHFVLLTFLSILISSAVLLPAYYAIRKTTYYDSLGVNNTKLLYNNISTHLLQLLPNSSITTGFGPPNIYSGLISLILLLFYIFNNQINKRKRMVNVFLILFVFLSTNIIPLDLVWQYLHTPNALPSRYSFVLTFLLIDIASESIDHLFELSRKHILISLMIIVLIYIISLLNKNDFITNKYFFIFSGIVLLLLHYFSLIILLTNKINKAKIYLIISILFEIIFVSYNGIGSGGVVKSNLIFNHMEEASKLIEVAKQKDPYARLEIIGTDNRNAPFLYNYNGVSVYASSISGNTFNLLNKFFNNSDSITNYFVYNSFNPISDAIFNIKYFISFDKQLDIPYLTEISNKNNCYLYENKYYTSLAYMVNNNMSLLDLNKSKTEILNDFIYLGTSIKDVYRNNDVDLTLWEKAYNTMFDQPFNINYLKGNKLLGTINVKNKGIFLSGIPYDDGWHITINNQKIKDINVVKGFVSFSLDKGNYTIEMKYIPKGLIVGSLISLVSLFSFVYLIKRKII